MGDRANIYVHDGEAPGVYLYTHWGGYELPETVRTGLERGRSRWDDPQYLARILFDEMTADTHGDETGAGISAEVGDGEDRVVDVDTATGRVGFTSAGAPPTTTVPFGDYVKAGPAKWAKGEEE